MKKYILEKWDHLNKQVEIAKLMMENLQFEWEHLFNNPGDEITKQLIRDKEEILNKQVEIIKSTIKAIVFEKEYFNDKEIK